MSKSNIFETSWTNLVFENRNKEYGAYLLRQENSKTSLLAFLVGITFLTAALCIPLVYNYFNPNHPIATILPETEPLVVTDYDPVVIPPSSPDELPLPQTTSTIPEDITSTQLINPVVAPVSEATPTDITPNDELKNNSSSISGTTDTYGVGTGTSNTAGTGTGTTPSDIPDNAIVSSTELDKKPEFPGGIQKFYNYVGNNFERPELESETLIRISVSFVIEKDGSMTDIRILKDPGYGLGREAIRVLKSLKTKWSPGIIDGKPVRTSYNLPITVQSN